MKKTLRVPMLLIAMAIGGTSSLWAIGGDGAYFINTFENLEDYPSSSSSTETAFNVEGQGEWLYLNSFSASNASYIPDGSAHDLRMPKNGSYVITPILSNGVNKVTFDIGRASVKVYSSTDGGATWKEENQNTSGKAVTVNIGSDSVNRIKVANETSKDADIDNLAVYAQTYEMPVTLTTADATNITKEGATAGGSITKNGGETITEVGIVWSATSKEPTVSDNKVAAAAVANEFSVTLSNLREGSTIYYRAYALYGDTQSYGAVKSFKTLIDESDQQIDGLGRYFVQDFEDAATFPQEAGANNVEYYVPGQGSWIYKNAYKSTNSSYNTNGSTMNLRMPKNGSYVITPILNSGVKTVEWDAMRKEVTAFTSTDAGESWTAATNIASNGTKRTLTVEDLNVNRIKLSNDTGSDTDIDNVVVYAQAYGIPATVATGEATSITKNSAEVSGTILDGGNQTITKTGVIWSFESQPTLADNVIETEDPTQTSFKLHITGLKAGKTVYYRAFALSNAGYGYGDIKNFVTSPATAAVITTSEVTKSGSKYRVGGTVTDDGGLDLKETGVIYSQQSLEAITTTDEAKAAGATVVVMGKPSSSFSTSVELEAGTTYYIRAYVVTDFGTSIANQLSFSTDEVVETPDVILGDVIWCSPDGNDDTADGSENKPFFDVQKAIDIAKPGDRIWMKAGTYVYDKRINIDDCNGEPDKLIELWGYNGRAVLDFSAQPYHKHSDNPYQGIRLTSSYWHFKNLDITNASDNGLLIERNKPAGGSSNDIANRTQDAHDNIIELCNFYRNGDTGLQIKNLGAYNKIINCDSYLNCDEDEGDADGFAPKLSVGDGNYFYGCRAWANSDDGWDVYYKKEGGFGDNMTIILENCISYKNGFLDLETIAPKGNGNGFKCGSNQGAINVYMNRCLAIHNKAKGFDQNHNAGDIILNNCTGMTLTSIDSKSYSYRIYEDISKDHEVRLTNCIAINDNSRTDKRPDDSSQHGKQSKYGRFEIDETLPGMTIINCEFQSAFPEYFVDLTNDEELIAPRDEDGNIPETTFAHLRENTPLIDAGVIVEPSSYRGIEVNGISYVGAAPDLGAFEYDGEFITGVKAVKIDSTDNGLSLFTSQNGIIFVTVKEASGLESYKASIYDLTGRMLLAQEFNGATTAINLKGQATRGLVVIVVEGGNNFKAAAKAVVK